MRTAFNIFLLIVFVIACNSKKAVVVDHEGVNDLDVIQLKDSTTILIDGDLAQATNVIRYADVGNDGRFPIHVTAKTNGGSVKIKIVYKKGVQNKSTEILKAVDGKAAIASQQAYVELKTKDSDNKNELLYTTQNSLPIGSIVFVKDGLVFNQLKLRAANGSSKLIDGKIVF
jgi:type IV secretory pathway VirJ component